MQAVRDVARLAVVVGALAFGAGPVEAAPDGGTGNQNCPAGFVWIRMSGTGCVQAEPLPANGKIGYDGRALCIEPYVGIYEQRATSDGQPAPGTPYNSFAYLLKCVTQEDYEQAVARKVDQSGGTLDVATVAGLSVFGGAVVLGGSAVMLRRRRGPQREAARARNDARAQQIKTRLDELAKQRAELDKKTEKIRNYLNSSELTFKNLQEIAGLLATVVGAGLNWKRVADGLELSEAGAKVLSEWLGLYSSVTTTSGVVSGTELGEDEAREQLWKSLENVGMLQGVIDAEMHQLHKELGALGDPEPPGRLPEGSYTDYDAVQNRIDELKVEIDDLGRRRDMHESVHNQLSKDLDGIASSRSQLSNMSIEFEYQQEWSAGAGKTAGLLALVAGIAALGPAAAIGGVAIGLNTAMGTTASIASFGTWWNGLNADDRREAIALGLQGNARLRGSTLHQMEHAAAQGDALEQQIKSAIDYQGRLRAQQAKIASQEGRPHLWSDG